VQFLPSSLFRTDATHFKGMNMGLIIGRTPSKTHKPTAQVWIGNICVTVLDHHGKVRLDIEAPKDVPVLRGELKDQPKKGNA
jgi:hypothetical protein